MPNSRLRKPRLRRALLGAAMIGALALCAPLARGERAPDPRGPGAWGASAGDTPMATKKTLRAEGDQGYFRVTLHQHVAGSSETRLVYWMPRGSDPAAAPPEVRGTQLLKAVVAAGINRDRNLTFFGPTAYAFSPELGADAEQTSPDTALGGTGCPNGSFCVFDDNNYGGGGFTISGVTPWRPLSNWGWNDRISSAINKREKDSKLSEHVDGANPPSPGGSIHCYDGNSWHPDFSDGFNDEASGIRNSDFFTQC
jgi:hypothetical protein